MEIIFVQNKRRNMNIVLVSIYIFLRMHYLNFCPYPPNNKNISIRSSVSDQLIQIQIITTFFIIQGFIYLQFSLYLRVYINSNYIYLRKWLILHVINALAQVPLHNRLNQKIQKKLHLFVSLAFITQRKGLVGLNYRFKERHVCLVDARATQRLNSSHSYPNFHQFATSAPKITK